MQVVLLRIISFDKEIYVIRDMGKNNVDNASQAVRRRAPNTYVNGSVVGREVSTRQRTVHTEVNAGCVAIGA